MSVTGEFRRVLTDCATLLRRSPGAATQLEEALSRADRVALDDLEGAAELVLRTLESGMAARSFGSDLEREEFARVAEHLRAICRVILGR
jgi:hypothetical protein